MLDAAPLLVAEGLNKWFASSAGPQQALRDFSLTMAAGESVALVGESGSGKSTAALCLAALLKPDSGQVWLNGIALHGAKPRELQRLRRNIGIVLQNPLTSLNPRRRIWQSVAEPLQVHQPDRGRAACRAEAEQWLQRVGLDATLADRFPSELSGGQLQRAAIARALILRPALLLLDEPTSALDVSVQAQVLNLLCDLRDEFGLSYLFITHNLAIVEMIAKAVQVMYAGRVVEAGPARQVLSAPRHPYTAELLSAIPNPDPTLRNQLRKPAGEPVRSAIGEPTLRAAAACPFSTRCPQALAACSQTDPGVATPAYPVACLLQPGRSST
jgi:oligopeptide/dipeptide ABC transporter ATP-binding protein